MHVAIRGRDEPSGYAGASELYGVGVRAGRTRVGLQSVGDVLFFGGGDKVVGDDGAQVHGPRYDGAAAQSVVAVLVLGDARGVGGVGDVHGDGRVGVQPESGAARPVESYL